MSGFLANSSPGARENRKQRVAVFTATSGRVLQNLDIVGDIDSHIRSFAYGDERVRGNQ